MPLWFVVRDDELWSWTFAKSQKVRNLERDPRATLQVEAGSEYHELRGVMLKADVTIHRDTDRVADARPRALPPLRGGGELSDDVRAMVHAQAPKRVALQFTERSRATWDHRKLAPTSTDERPHPLRRQGHAPAPDHPHERQAARAGRQQAGALLRHRGDGRGRHRGGRDHHRARDGRRDPRGGRRRLAVRREDHLRRAGRAARASRTRRSRPSRSSTATRSSCTSATTSCRAASPSSSRPSARARPTR